MLVGIIQKSTNKFVETLNVFLLIDVLFVFSDGGVKRQSSRFGSFCYSDVDSDESISDMTRVRRRLSKGKFISSCTVTSSKGNSVSSSVGSSPVNVAGFSPINPVESSSVNPVESTPVNLVGSYPVESSPVNLIGSFPVESSPVSLVGSSRVNSVGSSSVNSGSGGVVRENIRRRGCVVRITDSGGESDSEFVPLKRRSTLVFAPG